MGGAYERESGARPGLEAHLCLGLSLINFQRKCSRPPSSLMKPSGICQPSMPLQPAPFIYPPLSPAVPNVSEHTPRSIAQALHVRSHGARRLLFGVLFGCISTLSPNKEEKAKPGEQEFILSLFLCFSPASDKPQDGACSGITARSRAQSPQTTTSFFPPKYNNFCAG